MKKVVFCMFLMTLVQAQAKTDAEVRECRQAIAVDTRILVEIETNNTFEVVSGEEKDALINKAIEKQAQSVSRIGLGKVGDFYCDSQQSTSCKSDFAQDTRIYVELATLNLMKSSQERKDTLTYKAIELILESPNSPIGKIVDSYCRQ